MLSNQTAYSLTRHDVPADVWYAFLRCWTASVGTPGYAKTDFITVERFLLPAFKEEADLDVGRAAFQRCQGRLLLNPAYKGADWHVVEDFIYACDSKVN